METFLPFNSIYLKSYATKDYMLQPYKNSILYTSIILYALHLVQNKKTNFDYTGLI